MRETAPANEPPDHQALEDVLEAIPSARTIRVLARRAPALAKREVNRAKRMVCEAYAASKPDNYRARATYRRRWEHVQDRMSAAEVALDPTVTTAQFTSRGGVRLVNEAQRMTLEQRAKLTVRRPTATPRRAPCAREHRSTRSRRTAASSSTSSADPPPSDDSDLEPPSLAVAPPPRAIYTYGSLSAKQRGEGVA